MPKNVDFHGEFSSADASALSEGASRFRLYGAGSTTELSLESVDAVVITDYVIVSASALTVQIYDGSDNTAEGGEIIVKGSFAANDGVAVSGLRTPHYCQAGTYPKVKASASGQVDVTLRGYIVRRSA